LLFPPQLHIAAANGYTEVMDFLLANEEVDLDIPDNEGWTPFHAAVCWNQPEMMKKLAEKGADMDLKNLRGETAYGEPR
jgi:protein phosphatase 1 regulatory subunit 16A